MRVKQGGQGAIGTKQLWQVAVGDEVESVDPLTGAIVFSQVYFITHDEDGLSPGEDLLRIEFKAEKKLQRIVLHPNHLIYVSADAEDVKR